MRAAVLRRFTHALHAPFALCKSCSTSMLHTCTRKPQATLGRHRLRGGHGPRWLPGSAMCGFMFRDILLKCTFCLR